MDISFLLRFFIGLGLAEASSRAEHKVGIEGSSVTAGKIPVLGEE
jgi:hypothetical protein